MRLHLLRSIIFSELKPHVIKSAILIILILIVVLIIFKAFINTPKDFETLIKKKIINCLVLIRISMFSLELFD